jgi:hypothetical protein
VWSRKTRRNLEKESINLEAGFFLKNNYFILLVGGDDPTLMVERVNVGLNIVLLDPSFCLRIVSCGPQSRDLECFYE